VKILKKCKKWVPKYLWNNTKIPCEEEVHVKVNMQKLKKYDPKPSYVK
jgi:hypothetical protein